jgi:DNA-binding protein H-NS
MAKIDLNVLSIEELVTLRDNITDKLAEKVAARQAELEAEMEKLSQYGKPAKKAQAAAQPTTKARKSDDKKNDTRKNDDYKSDEGNSHQGNQPIAEAA